MNIVALLAVQTNLYKLWRKRCSFPKKPKKKINKKELRNAGQVYTTCIVLVFLHIVSYFLFTYLKILTGSIFSLFLYVLQTKWCIGCTLAVHCSGNYCDFFFCCVELNTHACQRLFKILIVSQEKNPYYVLWCKLLSSD